MKLLNKLITNTAIYKHLNALYQQALRDMEVLQENARKVESEKLEIEKDHDDLVDEATECIKNCIKTIKKIRTHVNKLDKKDENVKEIKRLIKEVLC